MQASVGATRPAIAPLGSLQFGSRPGARQGRPFRPVSARAADTKPVAEQSIDGLPASYCDDFECTSSPSVEASVRQLAKDLTRANGKWTPIYASNVEYSDAFRRFKGPDGYARLDFVATSVGDPAVSIQSMRMLDNSAAEIRWRLTGWVGPLPVDVEGTTEVAMNLLTGRIERHSERWDLRLCSPPAAAAWTVTRALWAAKQASTDAGAAANQVLNTLTSVDDEDTMTQADPNDPMKFFQQKDSSKQDTVFFVAIVLLFWAMVQAWTQLFSGGGGSGNDGAFF
ncbi:hypothetical protein C2E20_7333 [Micractinium conductrix]|uniref:Uncharacterized protein n=1 Tax=Micractinium conductrix TaxID=554055 RepID=A0A2P6V4Y9_9CHLO|nr:hypothetical protein C2E20_7333 [Micractinium conductrix]|eukprot:PSC69156.1 hypothetical protein C2E20_7333 [Micractinium conductrix]